MGALRYLAGAALALIAVSASAEPWQRSRDRLAVPAAGISFPAKAATISLTETGEASRKGDGVDNLAQYKSADQAVFATLFVYLPAYSDAALASFELDKVIRQHLGPGPQLASSGVVPVGGVAAGAIRRVYVDAAGGKLATSFAVTKIGHWIAVVRVSGPMARRAEVEGALDALVSGLAVSGAGAVEPVEELKVGDCPAPATKTAKRTQLKIEGLGLGNDPMTRMLIDSTLAAGLPEKGKEKEPPFPPSIADNGRRPVCVRERVQVGDNVVDMMQAAGDTAKPTAVIGIVNDAGKTIEMRRGEMGQLYMLRLHDVGRTANYGAWDRLLTPQQVAAVLQGNPKAAAVSSETVYKADLTFGTNVYVTMGR
ncbi:MAG TPA: hypothetical protein VGC56_14580 [Allosphingosinicella sp.]|jgi:hypothetical protein